MPSICKWFSNAHLKPGSWELNISCIYFHIIWLFCQHFHSCPVSGCLQPSYKIRLSCPRPPRCCSTPHLSKRKPHPFHSLGWNCLSHPRLLSFYHNSYPVYEHSCWISRLTIPPTFTPISQAQMALVSFLDSCNYLLAGPLASVISLFWSSIHATIIVIVQ